ncbi:MAG: hypothetical protein A4E74_01530 [Syntrophus sp. PtaB.Bin075]|nr:MAG: hypothetical protein A4E74_01530 [Syntrophus sp. PtaB.Bin075]
MSEEQKRTDADVEAAKEIYEIARSEANTEIAKLKEEVAAAKDDGFMLGIIKGNKAHRDYSNFLDAVVLYRAHKTKNYKKQGLTWEKFCEAAGYERRTADNIVKDIAPVFEAFSENLPLLSGISLNEIRWLGKSKTEIFPVFENGHYFFGEEKIPFTPEDVAAYVKQQKESHKQEIEEKDATIRTKERLISAKEAVITKMERELARLEKTVQKTDLTEEEQDAVNLLQEVQRDFIQWIADIKRKIKPGQAPEIALRQLYFLYIFMSKVCMEERLDLHEFYQHAEDVPWEITEMEIPSAEILIDNTPLTAGMGRAYKEKIEQRKAAKEK